MKDENYFTLLADTCLYNPVRCPLFSTFPLLHSCPILSNRFHPTKQHSICCRSENCISLPRSGQSAVDSIDSFDLSNGKVYYRFDKCGRRSDMHLISDNGDPVQDCRIDRFVRLVGMVISFTVPH